MVLIVNFSAFLIGIARRCCESLEARDETGRVHLSGGQFVQEQVFQAIVFSMMALEAFLNEVAFIEITKLRNGSQRVYEALERQTGWFRRLQTILTYFFGRGLADGDVPVNDLKHLVALRHGLVHYRFQGAPKKTLKDLSQRGLVSDRWDDPGQEPYAWPIHLKPELGCWAYNTACDTVKLIEDLMPEQHRPRFTPILSNFHRM